MSLNSIAYHAYTVYLFSRDNIKDIICMGFLFGSLNASVAPKFSMGPALSTEQILLVAPKMLLWSWSNLFIFNLHNQRHVEGIAEDALNKPWRPIPAGRISTMQTTRLMYLMYPVILGISLKYGGLGPCLAEALFCLWYNEWGGASRPFTKNLQNGLGFACFFAGPLEVATGHSVFSGRGTAAVWLAILTAAVTTTVHMQDFRDMDGDRAVDRWTVPLAIGDFPARAIVALGIMFWTIAASFFWKATVVGSWAAWLAGGAVVLNLFRDRSRTGDAFTWKMWPAWVLGLFLLPIIS
ncbi:hypothetical protein EV127DRAFT_495178 [Xylaria flabelliformis]|nr:hypothetical protein EV127DRAFT_495178 [Xylaria flabelliformis]KAI0543939.1 hypothetical protein F4679DRAFT_577254 [Xylaria curta]